MGVEARLCGRSRVHGGGIYGDGRAAGSKSVSRSVGRLGSWGKGGKKGGRGRERDKAERQRRKAELCSLGHVFGDLFCASQAVCLDVRSWPPRRWWRILISVVMA